MGRILLEECEEALRKYNLLVHRLPDEKAKITDCNGDTVLIVPCDIKKDMFEWSLRKCKPSLESRKMNLEILEYNLSELINSNCDITELPKNKSKAKTKAANKSEDFDDPIPY